MKRYYILWKIATAACRLLHLHSNKTRLWFIQTAVVLAQMCWLLPAVGVKHLLFVDVVGGNKLVSILSH